MFDFRTRGYLIYSCCNVFKYNKYYIIRKILFLSRNRSLTNWLIKKMRTIVIIFLIFFEKNKQLFSIVSLCGNFFLYPSFVNFLTTTTDIKIVVHNQHFFSWSRNYANSKRRVITSEHPIYIHPWWYFYINWYFLPELIKCTPSRRQADV